MPAEKKKRKTKAKLVVELEATQREVMSLEWRVHSLTKDLERAQWREKGLREALSSLGSRLAVAEALIRQTLAARFQFSNPGSMSDYLLFGP